MQGLHHSIGYMPESGYKHFNNWLLAHPHLCEDWVQLMGLRNIARMTDEVLEGVLTDEQLDQMVPLCVPMTLMLTYEVASDNVAIGLANRLAMDTTRAARIELLTRFSEVMIKKLQGDPTPTIELMAPLRDLAGQISSFSQSLNSQKYEDLLAAYVHAQPNAKRDDIEYSLYELLVANTDCGVDVLNILDGYTMQPFVRDWLIRRYQGQTFLINHPHISQDDLIRASIDAIMVVPTLAYYVAHFVERVAPNPKFITVLNNGILLQALEKSALLVRLLNDMGTDVLEQSDEEHAAWVGDLRQEQRRHHYTTLTELLMNHIPQRDVSFTRLKKDVVFGEYNLALHFALLEDDVERAIDVLYTQLCFVSQLYRTSLEELSRLTATLEQTLGTPEVGRLMTRFVKYHQTFYRNSFEEPTGEYGI